MSNIPEMTFFESFRIIDSIAEAVSKIKEASETIRKNGPNLKKWEAEGKATKNKIKKEIDEVKERLHEAQADITAKLKAMQDKAAEAAGAYQPAMDKALSSANMLAQVEDELIQARGEMSLFIETSAKERALLNAEGEALKTRLSHEADLVESAAKERLLHITTAIDNAKFGISEL